MRTVQTLRMRHLRGKFIVLDGPDGAGKSTHHRRLETALRDAGVAVTSCRDPGGTLIGDRVRGVLLDHDLSAMDPVCETLLFMASRAQLLAEVIRPALVRGETVLCDRFVSSTCAYQGAAGFAPTRVIELARFVVGEPPYGWPDMTIILDVSPETGFARIGRTPKGPTRRRGVASGPALIEGCAPDAMESRPLEFHRRVRELFLELPTWYPSPVRIVDATGDTDAVHARLLEALADVAP